MLVFPVELRSCKSLRSRRRWWWIGNFSDKISCGCFRDAIYENAEKRNLEEESKGHGKPKQDSFTIFEPPLLLRRVKLYTIEIRHKLYNVRFGVLSRSV